MRAQWKCDQCPHVGHLAPKTEKIAENHEIVVAGPKGPEKRLEKRLKMTHLRSQDPHTGKMYDHEVFALKDLSPRISVIQLRVGDENISVQLCKGCLKGFREKFTPLWQEMEKIVNGT